MNKSDPAPQPNTAKQKLLNSIEAPKDRIYLALDCNDERRIGDYLHDEFRLAKHVRGIKLGGLPANYSWKMMSGLMHGGRHQVSHVYLDEPLSGRQEPMRNRVDSYLHGEHTGGRNLPHTRSVILSDMIDLIGVDVASPRTTKRAMSLAKEYQDNVVFVASTIPPEVSEEDYRSFSRGETIREGVVRLGRYAVEEGFEAITCSAHEIDALREDPVTQDAILIATGLYMPGDEYDPNYRAATAAEAQSRGADFFVLGRSVMNDVAPRDKLYRIIDTLE